jgi:anti-sigma factor RsiW
VNREGREGESERGDRASRETPACRETEALFERALDGEASAEEIQAIKAHAASCSSCREVYALDLALIEAIKARPDEAFESVAASAVRDARAQSRMRLLVRWGAVVGMIVVATGASARFGLGAIQLALSWFGREGADLAARKVLAVLNAALSTVGARVGEALGLVGEGYLPAGAISMLLMVGLALFIMYLMGRWLRKPMEVRSWH